MGKSRSMKNADRITNQYVKELEEKLEMYELIYESIYNGSMVTDAQGYVTHFNQPYGEFLGMAPEEQIGTDQPGTLSALQDMTFAEVTYSYYVVDEGVLETWTREVTVGPLAAVDGGGDAYMTNSIMQRNFCVLRLGLSMRSACQIHHDGGDADAALRQLEWSSGFCTGVNYALPEPDPAILEDLALVAQLMENLCPECSE